MSTDQQDRPLRQKYMADEMTHDEYYLEVARRLGFDKVRQLIPFGLPDIRAALQAGDKHLNSLRLVRWDSRNEAMRSLLTRKLCREINGTGGWSLSDSVCTLKSVARHIAQTDTSDRAIDLHNRLFKYAITHDGFRIWYYPNMPDNYDVGIEAQSKVLDMIQKGLDTEAAFQAIREHVEG